MIRQQLQSGRYRFHPYRGESMRPTFRPGSMLLLVSIPSERIRPGDIVAFCQRSKGRSSSPLVVHRVITRTETGFITRGDNNPACDRQSVPDCNLVGRVAFVVENGKQRPVRGGRAGQAQAFIQRLWHCLSPLMGWPYRLLRASGTMHRLWKPHIARVHVITGKGPVVKYIHRRRTVARWWPEENRFWCRKPYDLVLTPPRGQTLGEE